MEESINNLKSLTVALNFMSAVLIVACIGMILFIGFWVYKSKKNT